MDAAAFDAAVRRLQALIQPKQEWPWIAERLVKLLWQYPDGLTDGILRSTLQQGAGKRSREELGRTSSKLDALLRRRSIPDGAVLELRVDAVGPSHITLGPSTLGPSDKEGAPSLRHYLDARLLPLASDRRGLLAPGRMLRFASATAAEHARDHHAGKGGDCGLLLLPTPLLHASASTCKAPG